MQTSQPADPTTRQLTFGDVAIVYDNRVLAPRPWTAAQSAWATEAADEVPSGPILELCAGVGHIGLLAMKSTGRRGVLVDIDPVACEFGRGNAAVAGLSELVEVRQRPVVDCLDSGERFPLVIADPPWVPSQHVGRFPEDPELAIDGGTDGLTLARACVSTIDQCLHPDGAAVVQLGTVAQADDLGDWMADERIDLATTEVRTFGESGVLMLLGRPA
ncbi:methyltransferase [Nocardioides sp. JQ2195]|uniref:methyltransferase n=1 Tax=Nocardioides sp. JQ2195 TaxID=2592334 RepID=UPI00143E65E9|nr:methyltransferase [Nocardioides sp. JQ2195]QIX27111.1 methyltransferase [Nocardioides sp. JQ2195]